MTLPSFIHGVGGTLDILSTRGPGVKLLEDHEAIRSDWNAIGNDIKWSINNYRHVRKKS